LYRGAEIGVSEARAVQPQPGGNALEKRGPCSRSRAATRSRNTLRFSTGRPPAA